MKQRAASLMSLFVVLTLPLALGPGTGPHTLVGSPWAESATAAVADPLVDPGPGPRKGHISLSFVPNAGQTDPRVRFQVHAMGGTAFFTPEGIVLSLPSPVESPQNQRDTPAQRMPDATDAAPPTVVRIRFRGASPTPQMEGQDPLPGIVNYVLGRDPTRWRTNLPTYAAVIYRELYPDIDLRYDGETGGLKGTYVVAPGADPDAIQVTFEGVKSVEIGEEGDLILRLPHGEIRQEAPYIYQESNGTQEAIPGRYALHGGNVVGFQIGDYDAGKPLLIDPHLVYSTFLGGSSGDAAGAIAVDDAYSVYVTGGTASADFPAADPGGLAGAGDVFVTKLNRHGSEIVYTTFVGGNEPDYSRGIEVDEDGCAYVVGTTESSNFPIGLGAADRRFAGGQEAFVVKLDPTGSQLAYATYLGGDDLDSGEGIAVDDAGYAYVTGSTRSEDFPTMNPYQSALGSGGADAFVAKLNPSGSSARSWTGRGAWGGWGMGETGRLNVSRSAFRFRAIPSRPGFTKTPTRASPSASISSATS